MARRCGDLQHHPSLLLSPALPVLLCLFLSAARSCCWGVAAQVGRQRQGASVGCYHRHLQALPSMVCTVSTDGVSEQQRVLGWGVGWVRWGG
jgi:hypothetical protein